MASVTPATLLPKSSLCNTFPRHAGARTLIPLGIEEKLKPRLSIE
jgi:hypothetical protein